MEEKNYEKYNHPGYVEQLKPETKYTSRKVQVDGITLYDSEASFRRNFLKKHLKNTVAAFAAGLYWLTEYRGFMFVYASFRRIGFCSPAHGACLQSAVLRSHRHRQDGT